MNCLKTREPDRMGRDRKGRERKGRGKRGRGKGKIKNGEDKKSASIFYGASNHSWSL